MKQDVLLTVSSLLTLLFLTLHLADDIVRGFSPGGVVNLIVFPVIVIWLYGTLVLSGRRPGYIINLLGSLLALYVCYLHMTGKGLGTGRTAGAFFFVWTIFVIGSTALFSLVLAVQGLVRRRDT